MNAAALALAELLLAEAEDEETCVMSTSQLADAPAALEESLEVSVAAELLLAEDESKAALATLHALWSHCGHATLYGSVLVP